MNACDLLIEKINKKNNPSVAGLDPRLEYLPEELIKNARTEKEKCDAISEFNRRIIDCIKDIVPAVKIQSAFYELYGWAGVEAMEKTALYAKQNGLFVMADVKRNDIGSTAEAYAAAFLDGELFDCITVNPYLGYDGIKPFTDKCTERGKSIFVLCRTSNPSAAAIQNAVLDSGETVYMRIGRLISEWGEPLIGKYGYSSVGAVVGATNPEEAKTLRQALKSVFFLVPGYGAQGGKAAGAAAAFDSNGCGAIVNNSRGIIAAYLTEKYKGMTYYAAARGAAEAMKEDLNTALKDKR